MMRTPALTVAVALLLGGTARAEHRPPWLDGESAEWPRHWYLTGVGVADEREAALDRARAEVARVFSTRVQSTTSSAASEQIVERRGVAERTSSVSASDEARSSTDRVLEGVEIAATWQDPQTRRHHALAVLDRRRARASLSAQLQALGSRARPLLERVEHGDDPVDGALAGFELLALSRRRDALVGDLRVVAPGVETEDGFDRVHAATAKALARVVVTMSIEGEGADVLGTGITEGLAAVGLRAGGSPEEADLVVEARVSGEDLGRRDGWSWSRASTQIVIRAARSGQTIAAVEETARESATLRAEAPGRAVRSLAKKVAKRIPEALASRG